MSAIAIGSRIRESADAEFWMQVIGKKNPNIYAYIPL